MKKIAPLVTVVAVLVFSFAGGVSPAFAQEPIPDTMMLDTCANRIELFLPPEIIEILIGSVPPDMLGDVELTSHSIIIHMPISNMMGLTEAPVEHDDGRLNYRVCRAPIAVYMDESGGVEVWTTDEFNGYAKKDFKVSADAAAIAAALAEAADTLQDVVIAGYVDGVALIAKPDGTLKAELIGVYGFDFNPDGSGNNGWGVYFEEFDWDVFLLPPPPEV